MAHDLDGEAVTEHLTPGSQRRDREVGTATGQRQPDLGLGTEQQHETVGMGRHRVERGDRGATARLRYPRVRIGPDLGRHPSGEVDRGRTSQG